MSYDWVVVNPRRETEVNGDFSDTVQNKSDALKEETSIYLNLKLILANVLITGGPEDSITQGALVYEIGGSILYAGAYHLIPPEYRTLQPTFRVPVLLPGLWDSHMHLTGAANPALDDLLFLNKVLAGARLSRDLAALLNAGYTSVIEMGGYGYIVRQAVKEGWIPGPNIYSGISILSITGGHGDAHSYPLPLIEKASEEERFYEICDGPDACTRAVRKKLRQGADIIKIASSGGVLSLVDSPLHQQFSAEELSAMVSEAARAGRRVTAHAHGKPGIMSALKAGVQVIQHGTYLDDECIALMKKNNVILTATRSISAWGVNHPELFAPEVYKKLVETGKHHAATYAKAVKAGVRIVLGTDLAVSSEKVDHNSGMNARELKYAVEAGMTPIEAIRSSTAYAPEVLGREMAPKSGKLEAGYDADFIAVSKNPLVDVEILLDSDNITHVWKAGKLYKKPGHSVGFFPVVLDH